MKCQNCHAENPNTAAFCNKCGAKLVAAEGQPPRLAEKKKRGIGKTLVIVVGAVVVLCLLAAIIASLGGGGGEEVTPTAARLGEVQQTEPAQRATESSIDTPSPTEPTATPTAEFRLILPQEVKNEQGWVFTINRVDFLESIDTDSQSHRPKRGIFIVMIGTVSNFTDEFDCIQGWDFTLRNSSDVYEMSSDIVETAKQIYDLDYPGFWVGQCLDYDDTEDSYLVFDVPTDANDLWLRLGDAEIPLGQISSLIQATPIAVITARPTPEPMPTPTLRPTSAPRPSAASMPLIAKLGWLCDYDGTGRIRLWTAASMQATVKDVVGTCIYCCVDVNVYEEELVYGIIFYRISVGDQSGWVDVDYFYWDKPEWCRN